MKSWKKYFLALLSALLVCCAALPMTFAAELTAIPITGDNTNYGLVIGIICAAVAVIVIAVILGMRKKSGK